MLFEVQAAVTDKDVLGILDALADHIERGTTPSSTLPHSELLDTPWPSSMSETATDLVGGRYSRRPRPKSLRSSAKVDPPYTYTLMPVVGVRT